MKTKVVFFTLFCLIWALSAQAILAPQVYLTDINLSQTSISPGEELQGTVTFENYEDYQINDLVFKIQILGDKKDGVPTKVIDEKQNGQSFSMNTGATLQKNFSYQFPSNLPQGNFIFRIQLANQKGEEWGWIDENIKIESETPFLSISDHWIEKAGEHLPPGKGVVFEPGQKSKIGIKVTNESKDTITTQPQLRTYKRNTNNNPLNKKEGNSIKITPGATETFSLNLPSITTPQTYVTEVQLLKKGGNTAISNSVYFRWIISGVNAEVISSQLDKESYSKGEKAQVKTKFAGPADPEIEGGSANLKIELKNDKGEIIGKTERKISLTKEGLKGGGELITTVSIQEDIENPQITTSIRKGDKILDSYSTQAEPQEPSPATTPSEPSHQNRFKYLLAAFFGILLTALAILYLFRTKNTTKTNPSPKDSTLSIFFVFVFAFVIISFSLPAQAATEVTDGCCNSTLVFNKPTPNRTFKPGDLVNFSGKYRVTGCGDGLFFNKVTFYLTEDKDIPITDCCGDSSEDCGTNTSCLCPYGCENAYGAASGKYSLSQIEDIKWCDEVKYLDIPLTSSLGHKLYKLGTIYPPDTESGAKPYWVEYNTAFKIPEDTNIDGNARLYVQYSGTHWKSHWHWSIAYQPAIIDNNNPPYTENYKVEEPSDQDFCAASKGEKVINYVPQWTYRDPDNDPMQAYKIQLEDPSGNRGKREITGLSISEGKQIGHPLEVYTDDWLTSNPDNELNIKYDQNYNWRVDVRDSYGTWSGWSPWQSLFVKPRYPRAQFEFEPKEPSIKTEISFDASDSEVYDGSQAKLSWDFDGNGIWEINNTTTKTATHIYNETGTYPVTLQVKDSSPETSACFEEKEIKVKPKQGPREEVIPR